MTKLKETVNAIAYNISHLSNNTERIATIVGLVRDFADETNMLALNATVEALRAGEQGKGFSVVAAEIRKLADQSRQSAENIDALILDIQGAISSTTRAVKEGTKTVESGVHIAQETAATFNGVRDAINEVALGSQQISLSNQQQATAIQKVVDTIEAI